MVSEIKESKVTTYKNKHNKVYTKLAEFQHYGTRPLITPPRIQNGLDGRCQTTQRYKDWRQQIQLILETVLLNIKDTKTKVKYVTLWADKEAHTYLTTVEKHQKDSLDTLSETLHDWTKPKADEIATFTQLQQLNQGNKTVSEFIQEVRRLVELCNLTCNRDKEQLIRSCIVAGITRMKAYQQCISKGSSLTPSECIKICQMEDANFTAKFP